MISYMCVESVLQNSLPHSLFEYKILAGEYFRIHEDISEEVCYVTTRTCWNQGNVKDVDL